MRYSDRETNDMLAAEYVLGTLHGSARRRFERLLETDADNGAALREDVERWNFRLNKLASNEPLVEPPKQVWEALERRLFVDQAEQQPMQQQGWLQRLALWRSLALGSSLAACALAAVLFLGPTAPSADYVVLIQNDAQQAVWTATASAEMDQFHVRNTLPMDNIPQDRGCLLWVRPAGSDTFVALGMLPDDGSTMTLDVDKAVREKLLNGKLLVTLEDKLNLPSSPTAEAEFSGLVAPLASSI